MGAIIQFQEKSGSVEIDPIMYRKSNRKSVDVNSLLPFLPYFYFRFGLRCLSVTFFCPASTLDGQYSRVLLKAVLSRRRPEPSGCRLGRSRFESLHDRPDTISSPGLIVVTVGWLLELSFKKPSKMRSLIGEQRNGPQTNQLSGRIFTHNLGNSPMA